MNGNAWVTRADVLKDLRQVNGRNAGANHLDQFVVEGDRAPPIRQESGDEEEMQYHFGPGCNMPGDGNTAPDLIGISRMLQMVDEMEDSPDSDEPSTIFRNTMTDEFSISKLNPNVPAFVPYFGSQFRPQTKPKPSEKLHVKPSKITKEPTFIRKSDKLQESNGRLDDTEETTNHTKVNNKHNDIINTVCAEVPKTSTINEFPKRKNDRDNFSVNSTFTPLEKSSGSKINNSSEIISLNNKLDVSKMNSDDIEIMKKEMKAKIIDSSKDTSIQKKRDRNVAMATLMKLCTTPTPNVAVEKPIKLITPQYFEPSNGDAIVSDIEKESSLKNVSKPDKEAIDTVEPTKEDFGISEPASEEPSTSTSTEFDEKKRKYVDPVVKESISKVNDWLNNTGSPKPKLPTLTPLKKAVEFKKKCTSNTYVVSPTPNSETSIDKEQKSCGEFVPSDYANDLLLKYEKNANSKIAPKEDLGTMLERQLKEKDQQIKKKLLEKKNAMSPSSGRSIQ